MNNFKALGRNWLFLQSEVLHRLNLVWIRQLGHPETREKLSMHIIFSCWPRVCNVPSIPLRHLGPLRSTRLSRAAIPFGSHSVTLVSRVNSNFVLSSLTRSMPCLATPPRRHRSHPENQVCNMISSHAKCPHHVDLPGLTFLPSPRTARRLALLTLMFGGPLVPLGCGSSETPTPPSVVTPATSPAPPPEAPAPGAKANGAVKGQIKNIKTRN